MLINPFPSINKVFSLVVQQERQLFLGVILEPVALVTKFNLRLSRSLPMDKEIISLHLKVIRDLICITPLRSVSTVASQDIQKKLAIGSIVFHLVSNSEIILMDLALIMLVLRMLYDLYLLLRLIKCRVALRILGLILL